MVVPARFPPMQFPDRIRSILRYTTSGMTTPGIRGTLATRISGSRTLSQRARLQVNLSVPAFSSVCELCTKSRVEFVTSCFYSL